MGTMEIETTLNAGEKRLLRLAREKKRPIYGSLELTPLCNMDCDMCFVRLSRAEMESQGRLFSAEEWLSLGRQMADSGVLYLQLTGGEPLLFPEFKELYIGLQKMGMILTLNTNGTLLDEEWADFFAVHRPRRINISLYGVNDLAYKELCHLPGGFARANNAIRMLRERDIDVKLNAPQTHSNRNNLSGYDAICETYGTSISQDTYIMPAQRERSRSFWEGARLTPEEAAKTRFEKMRRSSGKKFPVYLEEELLFIDSLPETPVFPREMSCMAASASFVVSWQGKLRPCIMLNEPEAPVFELGFDEAWRIIREKTDVMLLPEPCRCCRLRILCDTCAAAGILEEKDEKGAPIYLCRMTRKLEHLMREELEQLRRQEQNHE